MWCMGEIPAKRWSEYIRIEVTIDQAVFISGSPVRVKTCLKARDKSGLKIIAHINVHTVIILTWQIEDFHWIDLTHQSLQS